MASFVIVAAILVCFFSASSAHDFTISWVQNPKESFSAWSSRMRFQVNDKLVFKYNTADDSVLMVKKEDYDACNAKNPVQKLEGSSFQLTRSGPFYFISGVEEKCSKGEKLVLVVLAERNKKPVIPKPPTSPSPSSSPSLKPPTQSPTPPSTAPSVSPPISSMAPSVSSSPPASSMAPSVSSSPSSSMAPSVSSSPPSSSMAPGTFSESPASNSVNGGNEPVASPTSAQNAKSSTTALTASSLTIMMGAIMILGQALLLG